VDVDLDGVANPEIQPGFPVLVPVPDQGERAALIHRRDLEIVLGQVDPGIRRLDRLVRQSERPDRRWLGRVGSHREPRAVGGGQIRQGPFNVRVRRLIVLRPRRIDVDGPQPEFTFDPWPVSTFTLGASVVFSGENDLHYAINKASSANLTVQATIYTDGNGNKIISSLKLQGFLEDLYDFDFSDGGGPQAAAIMQTGFPTLGGSGAVYLMRYDLSGLDMAIYSAPE